VLCAGSSPPQSADALATTMSASEPASKSERGLHSQPKRVSDGRRSVGFNPTQAYRPSGSAA
jgi:hypothetical protein